MGSHDNEDMSFQHRKQTSSRSIATDPFFGSGWDNPLVSLSQSDNFGGGSSVVVASQSEFTNPSHYPIGIEAQGMSSTSHLVQYPSDSSYVEMVPKLQCFGGSGSFSEMVGSFGLPECAGMSNPGCVANYNPNRDMGIDRASAVGANEHDDRQITEEGALGASPNRKRRKRVNESSPNKNAEGELNKDVSGESSEYRKEQDEKKIDLDGNTAANVRGKQAGKQSKDTSQSGDAGKDSHIHVRARSGQATNSHSLAERVRREKISERMRLLQELVPGCNKITGKAVMLDEIINYVQSLQQQVEFLSMKLATVNPEVNADIERMLSKNIMNSRNGGGAIFGFTPGMNTSHPHPHGMYHGTLPNMHVSAPQFPSIPQTLIWALIQIRILIAWDKMQVASSRSYDLWTTRTQFSLTALDSVREKKYISSVV